LEDQCLSINGKTLCQLGLPAPVRAGFDVFDREVVRQKSYDAEKLQNFVATNKPLLIHDQSLAYNAITDLIASENGGLFFLDSPGGIGKTFLINLLLAEIRAKNEIALAVASSGIASTLLEGGRTAHSALKLPLNFAQSEIPICNISKGSGKAKLLQLCKVIVWDECTMAHKKALEALDRTMRDLRGKNQVMGGAVVVLAGDFRQTLPVIQRGTPADELNACLKASFQWDSIEKRTLVTNMRVHLLNDTTADTFAKQLLSIGDGKFPFDPVTGFITFPEDFCNVVPYVEDLIDKLFPNIINNYLNHQWLCERAILAPKNDSVNNINIKIQNTLPASATIYKSLDTVTDNVQAVLYPTEFLNSLELPGMPPHILEVKVGTPITLLRNIDPPKLRNGTRLCVKTLRPNVIEATISTGNSKGENVFIPRIPLIPNDMPFDFKRLQFPVRLAFAMTINKAQGQSLRVAGINLENPYFSHGQLYVACSRVGTPKQLYVYLCARKEN
jgi:ATP-dependent DNA helicase PIF1